MPFAVLQGADLEQLLLPIDDFRSPRGAVLFEAGRKYKDMLTLRRGVVKLQKELPEGRHRIIRLLRAGDVVGLEGLQGDSIRHTAVALSKVEYCRIPLEVVRQMEALRPDLQSSLRTRWDANLVQADRFMLELLSGDAVRRVARLLCFLEDFAIDMAPLKLTRGDMAAILDISLETASRVCSGFIKQGWLQESGQQFRIDRAAIDRLATAQASSAMSRIG